MQYTADWYEKHALDALERAEENMLNPSGTFFMEQARVYSNLAIAATTGEVVQDVVLTLENNQPLPSDYDVAHPLHVKID